MTVQHKERPVLTALILGALFLGIYVIYSQSIGDSDTKFHVYYLGSKVKPTVEVVKLDNQEVNKTFILDAYDGATYQAKEAGDYTIRITPFDQFHEITVYDRDVGGTKDVLIIVKDKKKFTLKNLETVSLIPIFYFGDDMSEENKQAQVEAYEARYPSYAYKEGVHQLPVRVDYGFGEGVPIAIGEGGQEAYYVLADDKRLNNIDRVSR